MITRKNTKTVNIGSVAIGGSAPISIQSMTNTDTRNAVATVEQILRLEEAGCEIVRVAVPDMQAAEALKDIKKKIHIPLVADIHFDYRLALCALDNGIDKLRINPGNIGDTERIRQVVCKASERSVPIRIGVNSGSLEKEILEKYNGVTPEGICESALKHVKILEALDFGDIIISVKASGVPFSIQCYEKISSMVDYPLHVGITEAGTPYAGTVKSSVGIGAILSKGIGDTIRVSLTGDPVDEVKCAKEILKSLELREFGIKFISCPTCGRTDIDLIGIAVAVENELKRFADKKITVAVMGCAVNGPGEAKEADIGIAGGDGVGLIFKKGKILKKVQEQDLVKELIKEIEGM